MPQAASKPELLLPAGSPEKLRFAIAYGADAVYLGLPMASLRTPSRGEQFTPQNLESWIRYCQERGVKAYVTANIFASNRDLERLKPHMEQLESIRPDAIILSDPGVFHVARQYAPSVPLHLSTQANTLNVGACHFWQSQGVSRVILAREVPVREMAEIHNALPGLELECFVHGSLCVAYSGRCVISDYLTDNTKNSNKGMCGNSCRWEFEVDQPEGLKSVTAKETTRPNDVYTFEEDEKGTYMLNSRDLCLVRRLRELQDSGMVSFKVEGRTKSVFYVATVGKIYREAIDYFQSHQQAPDELMARWVHELSQAGNRGFTEGFYNGRPDHLAYEYLDSKSHQGSTFLATLMTDAPAKDGLIGIQARNSFKVGETLDWMTPTATVSFTLTHMVNKHGFKVNEAQTNHQVWIEPPAAIAALPADELAWSMIRRKEMAPVAC